MSHYIDEAAAYRAQVQATYPDARLTVRTARGMLQGGFLIQTEDGHTLGADVSSARNAWMDAAIQVYRSRTHAKLN